MNIHFLRFPPPWNSNSLSWGSLTRTFSYVHRHKQKLSWYMTSTSTWLVNNRKHSHDRAPTTLGPKDSYSICTCCSQGMSLSFLALFSSLLTCVNLQCRLLNYQCLSRYKVLSTFQSHMLLNIGSSIAGAPATTSWKLGSLQINEHIRQHTTDQ